MLSKAERVMLWSSNIWLFGWGMLGPLYAVFAEQVGGTVLELSWVFAMFLVVTGVGVLVVGKVADRVGHERLLVGGYALSALATYGYLFVDRAHKEISVWVLYGCIVSCPHDIPLPRVHLPPYVVDL